MVILDTLGKINKENKNILYLNTMDIDYIVSKYGLDLLKEMLPAEYIEGIEISLNFVQNKEKDSYDYCARNAFDIVNLNDDKLLEILSSEITNGNILTKSQFMNCINEDLKVIIEQITQLEKEDNLSLEELYKLRTYRMAYYVKVSLSYAGLTNYEVFNGNEYSFELRSKVDEKVKKICEERLNAVGLSDEIIESDYFNEFIPLNR